MPQRRWTLSICSALCVAAIVATVTLLGAGLVVSLALTPESQFQREEDRPWVILASCFHLFNVIQSSIGVAGYIAVSVEKARPVQLHLCTLGVLLIAPAQGLFIVALILQHKRRFLLLWSVNAISPLLFAIRKFILYLVVKQKFVAFPSSGSSSCCQRFSPWVSATVVSSMVSAGGGTAVWIFAVVIRIRGGLLESPAAVAFARSTKFSMLEVSLMRLLYLAGMLGMLLSLVASVVVVVLARRLVQKTVTRLADRGVAATMLTKVRRTLRLHFLGMVVSISTGWVVAFGAVINISNALGTEAGEDAFTSLLGVLDVGGDVAGLILLSGVWDLLFQDDPDAGDFNRCIRSLLRSTVITSRAGRVFEGSVFQTPNNKCVVSFPGKFIEEWSELTWLCEQRELSSACVFLPTSDPKKRFGQHAQCLEDPTKRCWCYQLYGEEKPWGCLWFEVWSENVKRAVKLGLDLVVVFFPGEKGKGHVKRELLPTTDLWDGVGLGGSQKAEVAYLKRSGLDITEMDVEEARKFCFSVSPIRLAQPCARPRPH